MDNRCHRVCELKNHIKAESTGWRATFYYPGGGSYRGKWLKSQHQYYGIKENKNNLIYDGQWSNGQRHGYGMMRRRLSDGTMERIYMGEWCADMKSGEGKQFYEDGVYYGWWKNNRRHGLGIKWYKNGNLYLGEWQSDVPHGPGVLFSANGNRYEGHFVNGLKHGEGTFYHMHTGQVQKGMWINDVCKTSMVQDELRNQVDQPTPYPIPPIRLSDPNDFIKDMFAQHKCNANNSSKSLQCNGDIFSRININSTEWNECNIQRIIEKHLWWWYIKKSTTSSVQWICRQCWQELSSFHNFYRTVVQVHRQYQSMLTSFVISEICDDNKLEIKVEQESSEEDKNELKLRNRKSSESNSNIQIEEISVKSEFRFESNDNGDEVNYQCGDTEKCAKYKIDSLDIHHKDFLDINFNDSEESNHVAGCGIEDKILAPLTKNGKTKLIQKNKRKALRKTKSVKASPKKNKTKHKSEVKLNKLVNDNFFEESQHKLECSICNEPLSEFRTLKEHFRNEHNILGYAMCCEKKFFKRCLLIDHINVHKNPEYFKCNLCNKSFNLRRCLENHQKTHTQRERIFRCEDCGKSFFAQHVYERHKLIHVPKNERNFSCNHCYKKFASRCRQLQHETTAHNKKYFKVCDICGNSYQDNISFVRHMEEHAVATPSCETRNLCGLKLTNKYALTEHIKMEHNEEMLLE